MGTARDFLESKKDYLKEKGGKLRNQDIDDLLAYRRSVLKLEGRTQAVHELSREVKDQAIERLKRSSLLYDYGEFVKRVGVVGEERNTRIVLLALTSRLLDNLISLVIKAESSSGKSYLLKSCLKVYPEEYYFEYTAMSNRAMIYTGEGLPKQVHRLLRVRRRN